MSHSFVVIHLFLLTVLCSCIGCRAFSAMKRERIADRESSLSSYLEEVKKAGETDIKLELQLGSKAKSAAVKAASEEEARPNFIEAEQHFWRAVCAEPQAREPLELWAEVALRSKSAEECEKQLLPLASAYPDYEYLSIIFARVLCAEKKYNEAIEHLQESYFLQEGMTVIANELMQIYFRAGRADEAIAFFEMLDGERQVSGEILFSYAAWWYEMAEAFHNGHKKIHPRGFKYTEDECRKKLHELCQGILLLAKKIDGNSKEDYLTAIYLCEFLGSVGENELFNEAVSYLDTVPNVQDKVGYLLSKGENFLKFGDKERAAKALAPLEKIYNILTIDALKRLLELEIKLGRYAVAQRIGEQLLLKNPKHPMESLELLMDLSLCSGDYDNALLLAQVPAEKTAGIYYRRGLAQKEKRNYGAAERDFRQYEKLAGEAQIVKNARYCMSASIVSEKLHRRDEALRYAEMAWNCNQNAPELCNFYGYSLADAGVKLDFACGLIKRAVAAEPKNIAYLDSLAWVLYRQKHFAEAEEILHQMEALGIAEQEDDGEISSHFGDILISCGKVQEAVSYWKMAISRMSDAALKEQTQKKIDDVLAAEKKRQSGETISGNQANSNSKSN